jgi:single-strand DNA-binding protein
MANDFNKIIVSGRLGADPEMRYTESGMAVTSFNIANGQYDKNAENNELTTWYRVSIFGKRGEAANQYLAKGSRVLISGAHRIRKYTDKDGNERQSNEITADDFTFMDSKNSNGATDEAPARQPSKPAPAKPSRNAPQAVDPDEGLPF